MRPLRDRPLVNVAIMVFIPFQVCQLPCDRRHTEGTHTPLFRKERGNTDANGTEQKTPKDRESWHVVTVNIAQLW
jgi:hypothetical protein